MEKRIQRLSLSLSLERIAALFTLHKFRFRFITLKAFIFRRQVLEKLVLSAYGNKAHISFISLRYALPSLFIEINAFCLSHAHYSYVEWRKIGKCANNSK